MVVLWSLAPFDSLFIHDEAVLLIWTQDAKHIFQNWVCFGSLFVREWKRTQTGLSQNETRWYTHLNVTNSRSKVFVLIVCGSYWRSLFVSHVSEAENEKQTHRIYVFPCGTQERAWFWNETVVNVFVCDLFPTVCGTHLFSRLWDGHHVGRQS